jgi:integrative and conjugative element protein (TIGR02256 family)
MKFRRTGGGEFEISAAVLAVLQSHRQDLAAASESGGLILGRLIQASNDIIADEATRPSADDNRGRFFFIRRRTPAQRRVNEAWKESSSTRNYLGEWHTHPEDVPSPSAHDLQDWSRLIMQSQFEQDSLFFIIVGRRSVRVWEYLRGEQLPRLLEQMTPPVNI